MARRRKRSRAAADMALHLVENRAHRRSICDPSERATLATTGHLPSALLIAYSRWRNRRDTRPNPPRLVVSFLLHVCFWQAIVGIGAIAELEPVDSNTVSSSPVILKSEQRQLFRGLLYGESELNPSAQDVISFSGIRYASAPMRRLRFMPPTPFNYAPNQLHEARHFGPICMQRFPVDFNGEQRALLADLLPAADGARKLRAAQLELIERLIASPTGRFRQLLELDQSEDCLNLNIEVPLEATKPDGLRPPEAGGDQRRRADPANLRPVLVLLHGDSFDYGAGSTISGARRFASRTGLLVVTFNYRLNLLGFPPKVAAASGNARTNLGLLDQVALLHWLQANIRSFGGEPRNVTLLGIGRGALFVNLLMLSPLAKGLFQRAIIEGAAALSPRLANSFAQQQQVSWQHLRLLATMANCPLASDLDQQQAAARNSSADDLRRPLECLKASPAEALTQPVPWGLLDASAGAPGELVLARRWHRPLELLLRNLLELDQSLVGADTRRSLNELANRIIGSEESASGAQQLVQLSVRQLNRLIAQLITTRRLISSQAGASEPPVQRVSELLDELLGAIYLPSNETLIAQPAAPLLEAATLLPQHELDLMNSMLQPQSPFGQQDLLIGSPELLRDLGEHKSPLAGQHDAEQDFASLFMEQSQPDERFQSRIMQQTGLSDEQAIQQVGLFVRAHFRYHQQEISNSIISNYFLADQLASSSRRTHQPNLAPDGGEAGAALRLKQLQLLESLMAVYEDSLVKVPLVKTALVHSLKQLEALADLFVSQQIYRLSELVKQAPTEAPKLLAEEQRKLASLEFDFLRFAQQLYNQTELWPLDGRSSWEQQPRSTFFYQLASLTSFVPKVKSVIRKLDQKALDESRKGERALASIRTNLRDNLLNELLKKEHLAQHLSLACSLFETEASERDDLHLLTRLTSLICQRVGQEIIANFVISGNVNGRPARAAPIVHRLTSQLERYEQECVQADSGFDQPDHHSVQLDGPLPTVASSHPINSTVILVEPASTLAPRASCRRELDDLTLAYLASELDSNTERVEASSWPVFNLFSQYLISIGGLNERMWSSESLAATRGAARERFDRTIAFWANFLPTLNCSRTQPLGANALAQAHNSTLLNMNLNFNCHQGARTAGSLLQSIQAKIKTSLADWIGAQVVRQQQQNRWTSGAVNTLSTQNHHSLRMATGNESQLDEPNIEAERQPNRSAVSWPQSESKSDEHLLHQRFVSLFSPSASLLSIWLLCGAVLIGSTLLAGGCALARSLKQEATKEAGRKQASVVELENHSNFPEANNNGADLGELLSAEGLHLTQVQPPDIQSAGPFNNDEFCLAPPHSSNGFIDHPAGQAQRQTDEQAPETILLPILSNPHYFTSQCDRANETQHLIRCEPLGESSEANSRFAPPQQQQAAQVLSSSSETTTTITTRPQSSVSLVSGSTNTTNQTNNDTSGPSKQALNKKRVKISEPKRVVDTNYLVSFQQQQAGSRQVFLDGEIQQLASTNSFCPVHRSSSSNQLVQSDTPLGQQAAFLSNHFEHDDTAYLQMFDATQKTNFGVATVSNSLADYLNLLAPHQGDELASSEASKSLRYNSQGRNSKRSQDTFGLCQMHAGQTMR